jgi:hypothetical protein
MPRGVWERTEKHRAIQREAWFSSDKSRAHLAVLAAAAIRPEVIASRRKHLPWLREAISVARDECVEWPFPFSKRPTVGGKIASRVAYEICVGPIPDGLHVLHNCDNPSCVNPRHLFIGTHVDNMRDMASKGRAPRGERSGNAKLNAEQVKEILESEVSSRKLAPMYAVSDRQIRSIRAKQWWKHI